MVREALNIPVDIVEHMVFNHVTWSRYTEFLQEFEHRPGFKLTFDQGRLEIMSPLPEHEAFAELLGRLVELMSLEKRIPIVPLGSATFRNEAKDKGLEPDKCYYVAHAAAIRGIRGPFNPAVHPAPDLAIEVDITRRSIARQPIYASLGIPELWRVTSSGVKCLHLSDGGQYRPAERSLSYPFLAPAALWPWVQRLEAEVDVFVLEEFKAWVSALS